MNLYLSETAGVETVSVTIPHYTGVVQNVNQELGKMVTIIQNFDEQKPRHDSDRFKVKRNILLAPGLKDNDDSSNSDDSEDSEQPRSSESDENNTVIVNFGRQLHYGQPPGKSRRHNNSFGLQNRKIYDRDRGSTQEWDQKAFEQ